MILFKVIAYSGFIILICVAVFFASKFKTLSQPLRVFSIFLISLAFSESISKYLWYKNEENLHVLHIFGYVEWLILSWYYSSFYKQGKLRVMRTVALLVGLIIACGSLFLYPVNEYNVIGFFVLKLFVIMLSIREIYQHYFSNEHHHYYINLALILIAISNLVLFSFGNILTILSAETQMWLWIVNGLVFILGLFLIAFEILTPKPWKQTRL